MINIVIVRPQSPVSTSLSLVRVSPDVESGRVPRHSVVHVDVPGVPALGQADAARSLAEARLDVPRRQRDRCRQPLPQPRRSPSATVVLHQRPGCRLGVLHHPCLRYVCIYWSTLVDNFETLLQHTTAIRRCTNINI